MSKRQGPYWSAAWPHVRRLVLQRDKYQCQIVGKTCTGRATQVDHIVPWMQGGARFDPSNLRAACASCNRQRVHRAKSQGWRFAATRITLVMGPPGAGKTTYVREHADLDDLVLDWDAIAESMRPGESRIGGADQSPTGVGTGHGEATRRARNTVLRALERGELDVRRAWILSTNRKARSRFPHHDVVVLDPGKTVCKQRRPGTLHGVIDAWYDDQTLYQPSRSW
jgi:hypothetical protein